VARNWADALQSIGFKVSWVAGQFEPGWEDHRPSTVIPGLGIGESGPDTKELKDALVDADLVVVENLCTIPLNIFAARSVSEVLRGRPTLLHHHDPPWQRKELSHITELPPDDPAWQHVTINNLTRRQMAHRGLRATTIYNGFDTNPAPGDRKKTRERLEVDDSTLLLLHPVRAIPRKRVDKALTIASNLKGTYWLSGPVENSYGPDLENLLSRAKCPILRTSIRNRSDLYAAADLVVFPSSWEGFGNPPVEASIHRRPVVVGNYPVANELRSLGFRWFSPEDLGETQFWLNNRDLALLDHNQKIASTQLSLQHMTARLETLIRSSGWLP